MKIVLIALPHPYLRQPESQISLGLLYMASMLEKCAHDVEVKNYSAFTTEEAIADLPRADLYGITITSMELLQANRFAKRIKDKFFMTKIFFGGSGTISDEFVDWNNVDSICKGEGEITIIEMINDWRLGELKRIYIGKCVDDLDLIPFPARHLIKYQGGNIFAYNKNYIGNESVTILTSRGCPFDCAFCSAPHLSRYVRYRYPNFIKQEIEHVINEYGIRQFRISDDMFTTNEKHVREICKKIKDLDIVWRISVRAKPLSIKLLRIMKDAGCREVSIGVESFDNDVLRILNKQITAEENALALEMCADVGLKTRVLFMIRTPGQTKKTVPLNINWLQSARYDIIACTTFVPLPGSDIWKNPDKYNIEILNRNMDDYNFYFFNKDGENKLKNIIKIKDRSLEDLNRETIHFKEFLKTTGKLNRG